MKHTLILIFLASCASFSYPPEDAVTAASVELAKDINRWQNSSNTAIEHDPSTAILGRAERLDSSSNIGFNTAVKNWCIGLEFEVYHADMNMDEELYAVFLVSKVDSGWDANFIDSKEEFSGPAEYYEHVWDLCLQQYEFNQ